MNFDDRIEELFLDIPESPPEAGPVVHVVQTGKLLFMSGIYPWKHGKMAYKGRVGLELTVDAGKLAAHSATLQFLGILKKHMNGSLSKVKQIVSLRGYISSGAEFHDQHKVLDGASQLIYDVFGSVAGKHTRTAIGVTSLPHSAAVSLEFIVEVK